MNPRKMASNLVAKLMAVSVVIFTLVATSHSQTPVGSSLAARTRFPDSTGRPLVGGTLGGPSDSLPSDGIQYVSTRGIDSNDGQSRGTAKGTIAGAYAALPSCTIKNQRTDSGSYTSYTYDHCGEIYVTSGTYRVSSTLNVDSPFVTIRGSDSGSTVLQYVGSSGCAISWTQNPFSEEFTGSGGLYSLRLDGYGAGAGTCGLETKDISAFHMAGVAIWNFSRAGSTGWLDDTTNAYNEKFDVEVTLKNNAIGWKLSPGSTSPGYPNTTFGYGVFDVKIESLSGQTGILATNGFLSYSVLHITINEVQPNANGIVLHNSAAFQANTGSVHIEAPLGDGTGHELSVPSLTAFQLGGNIDIGNPASDVIAENPTYNLGVGAPQIYPEFVTGQNNRASANTVYRMNPCAARAAGCNVIDVLANPQSSYVATTWPSATGALPYYKSLKDGKCVQAGNHGLLATVSVACLQPAIALFSEKSLGSTVSLPASTLTTIDSLSVKMPAIGGPWRARVDYYYSRNRGLDFICFVTDGTNQFAANQGTTHRERGACNASETSPVTYVDGENVTFTVKTMDRAAAAIETVTYGYAGISIPSTIKVSIMPSN